MDLDLAGTRCLVVGLAREGTALARFLAARPQRFEPERGGAFLAAVYIEVESSTGRALAIRREIFVEDSGEDGEQ